MRVIGYVRVSTQDQADHGVSLDAQRAKIEAYCSLRDLRLVEVIEDAGLSAKNLERPGAQRILSMVKAREIDGVVVLKLDRLFRNTADAIETSRLFESHGVAFHSLSENLDTGSAVGKFYFTLMAGLAELERNVTVERTKLALGRKREKGEKLGGHCPFGFDNVEGKLVANESEQAILTDMRKMREAGYSFQRIANALNGKGVVSKAGGEWKAGSVHAIIKKAA